MNHTSFESIIKNWGLTPNSPASDFINMIREGQIIEKEKAIILAGIKVVFNSIFGLITALSLCVMNEGDSYTECIDSLKKFISLSISKDVPIHKTLEDVDHGITFRGMIYRSISSSEAKTAMEQLILHEIADSYEYYVKPYLEEGRQPDFLYLPDTLWTKMLCSFDDINNVIYKYATVYDPKHANYLKQ